MATAPCNSGPNQLSQQVKHPRMPFSCCTHRTTQVLNIRDHFYTIQTGIQSHNHADTHHWSQATQHDTDTKIVAHGTGIILMVTMGLTVASKAFLSEAVAALMLYAVCSQGPPQQLRGNCMRTKMRTLCKAFITWGCCAHFSKLQRPSLNKSCEALQS